MDMGACCVSCEHDAGGLDVGWLARLARGAMAAWLGCGLMAVFVVGGMLVPNLMGKPQAVLPRMWSAWPYVWFYVSAAVFIVGVWLLASRPSDEDDRSRDAWWRSSCRRALPAVVIALAYLRPSGLGAPLQDMALWPITAFIFAAWLVFVFVHIGRLARQLEARFLRRLATVCLVAVPVIWVLEVAPLLMIYYTPPGKRVIVSGPGQRSPVAEPKKNTLEQVETFCFAASQVVGIVLTALMLVLLAGCGRRFRQASRRAAPICPPPTPQPDGPDPSG